ncbi:DMT family transporter [Hyphococcus sp.]|uniref:DMT family transporter n=1 Tax=Hyphococcus sp. TaxID=2038636 RepID=UPI003D10F0CE
MREPNSADSAKFMARKHITPAEATLFDWALLALIVAFGGSSFAFIRKAVETAPPSVVAAGRLWVAAVLVYILMRAAGRRLPPFFIRSGTKWRVRRSWWWMIGVGASGNVLPFYLFPWAQQHVESGLAGVYMAFMPIWTLALAYFFAGENLTARKLGGFALGFIGVLILMGPEALKGVMTSSFLAQAGLLLATFLYGVSAVLSRRAPPIRPRVFASGMLIVAAFMAIPALFFTDLHREEWSAASLMSIVFLGVFPTGLNGVLIIMLIRRAGAGFMALSNYITPLWAVGLGAVIYHERLDWNVLAALAIILAGVAVSQRSPFSKKQKGVSAAGDGLAGELEPMVERTEEVR